ncbi:hypothetical protein [Pseudonocardia sediminis]|nr:hypothetical protein [Pseudonocardia sediminis]
MASLGANRDQVVRLVEAGLLPELGRRGRTRLLDPTALTELAARPLLPDAGGDPAAPTYALVLHLGPRRPEPRPELYYRDVHGFHADGQTPDNAWTGWWNTGEQIAQECVAHTMPVLPAVSGVVVDVRLITGYTVHPLYPGLVRFAVTDPFRPAHAEFTNTRLRPAAGSPWQRLRRPARSELAAHDDPVGAPARTAGTAGLR